MNAGLVLEAGVDPFATEIERIILIATRSAF